TLRPCKKFMSPCRISAQGSRIRFPAICLPLTSEDACNTWERSPARSRTKISWIIFFPSFVSESRLFVVTVLPNKNCFHWLKASPHVLSPEVVSLHRTYVPFVGGQPSFIE